MLRSGTNNQLACPGIGVKVTEIVLKALTVFITISTGVCAQLYGFSMPLTQFCTSLLQISVLPENALILLLGYRHICVEGTN